MTISDISTWCTECGIHLATPLRPICPVCESKTKERKQ